MLSIGHQLAQAQGKITPCLYGHSWYNSINMFKKLNLFCSSLYSLLFNIFIIASKVSQMLTSSNATFLQLCCTVSGSFSPYSYFSFKKLQLCKQAYLGHEKSLILIRSCHIAEKDKAPFVL